MGFHTPAPVEKDEPHCSVDKASCNILGSPPKTSRWCWPLRAHRSVVGVLRNGKKSPRESDLRTSAAHPRSPLAVPLGTLSGKRAPWRQSQVWRPPTGSQMLWIGPKCPAGHPDRSKMSQGPLSGYWCLQHVALAHVACEEGSQSHDLIK